MRNLARELELSPNLNIELNNSEVLSDAVDSLIEKLTPTSPVLAWLLDYIDERIRDDKRWNVSNEVKSFGRNIFDESYIERGEKATAMPSYSEHVETLPGCAARYGNRGSGTDEKFLRPV